MSDGPMKGISVLEVGVLGAGPLAGLLLADLGADVLKIEHPRGGDIYRAYPPRIGDQSHYFIPLNRNKRSLAIDLKQKEGREAFLKLAADADVIIENRRPGAMTRLGLGPDVLMEANPRLVHCSISGFGHTGPLSELGGYDLIVQGMSGLMTMVGHPGDEPVKVVPAVPDVAAALLATVAITAALRRVETSGIGDVVDMALFDATLFTLSVIYLPYLLGTGNSPPQMGSEHPLVASVQAYRARDSRYLTTGVVADWMWPSLCNELGLVALVDDVRFSTGPSRLANRSQLTALLSEAFLRDDRDNWVERLNAANIPCGPVLSLAEALKHPQVKARGLITTLPDERVPDDLRVVTNPIRYLHMETVAPSRAPDLGEHSRAVLERLGYSDSELVVLEKMGVVHFR